VNEDKSARYHRLRRRASVASTLLGVVWLTTLVATGASAALRDASARLAGGSGAAALGLYVAALVLISEAVGAPLAFYQGVTLERRYDLSTQTTGRWCLDYLKAVAVTLVCGVIAAGLVNGLIRWDPDDWWMYAAAAFAAILVVIVHVAPVVLLPLFYEFRPLDRAALVERLVRLADRAGASVMGVFEWRLGDRTKKANAALAGIGRTRRIIISDTLLAQHSDDEIEVILAHELAHHVHRDLWKGIALETALIALGCFLADAVLGRYAGSFGLAGKADVAALPLLVLAAGSVSLALLPLVNALSRAHERSADRYALEMTNNAPAFVSAMRRLSAQNLAEEDPSRLVEILFHTHPPINARIDAAQAWTGTQRFSSG
jgi:STE24 endopeptidase